MSYDGMNQTEMKIKRKKMLRRSQRGTVERYLNRIEERNKNVGSKQQLLKIIRKKVNVDY